MKKPIYLDYCSTTPLDKKIFKKMKKFLSKNGIFGNPSSRLNYFSWKAAEYLNKARNTIASILHVKNQNIIFTSGATESNNLAIKSIAESYAHKGKHIVTGITEHKSVINTCKYLIQKGFQITFLKPNKNGIFLLSNIINSIQNNTILITLMHVNNETGVIQDINKIGKICKKNKIIFHVDAVQSLGKLPINLSKIFVDLMSFSGHKIYGPKGIGILYIKKNILLKPQIHGGGQEFGIRSGTVPVYLAIGISEAFKIAVQNIKKNEKKIQYLRNKLWNGIKNIPGIKNLSNSRYCINSILNINFHTMSNQYPLIMYFNKIAISNGSSCNSKYLKHSYVLREFKLNQARLNNSLRISLGKFTTHKEIDYTIYFIHKIITKFQKNY